MKAKEVIFDEDLNQLLSKIEDNFKNRRYRKFDFDSNVKYGLFLRHLLLKGIPEPKNNPAQKSVFEKGTLYISVGEGDWAFAFLTRLFNETKKQKLKPKIKKLVVLNLTSEGIKKLQEAKKLPDRFIQRITYNIKGLEDLSKKYNFQFVHKGVNKYPDYHGYMYGKWALTGKWEKVKNKSNVRTGLTAYYNNENLQLFKEMFLEQGIYDGE